MRAGFLIAMLAGAGVVQAETANPIGADLAAILISKDCRMVENDLAIAMRNAGHPMSDYKAQMIALYRAGYLTAPTPGELQLINWDGCG